jgi:HAD superfamily hydrolase (TIGR01490 family)
MAVVTIGSVPSAIPKAAAWDPRCAVFDLDRTLLPGSSLGLFARALARAGLVTKWDVARHAAHQGLFAARGLRATTLERLCGELVAAAAGRPADAVQEVARQTAPLVAATMYAGGRWLIDQHAARGDRLILLSAGPQELVGAVSEVLGFHDGLGTVGEVVDGRYTGRLVGDFCHGEGKLRRLRTAVDPVGVHRAAAYGDAASDIPVLRAVARPVAVNPDRALTAAAEAAGWPVLRFA